MNIHWRVSLLLPLKLCISLATLAYALSAFSSQDSLANWLASARQGDASAQYNLGLIYELGSGVTRDIVLAAQLYE